ncbi:MAG: O-antigen ligase family protein [Bacilli bacterium]|nr:O-antigen ligase family protein [Bacilli bacterium]
MKKFKIDYLIYVFIVLSPFLDVIGFLFREWFPDASLSPATVLRPIIPLILLGYIFFKDIKVRKYLIISAIIFIMYGGIHLLIYNSLKTGISYGSLFSEMQYVINYTYMLYVFFIVLYFYKKNGLEHLKQSLVFMLIGYMLLIYIAILTGTSYTTYIEGMGYRGWFTSGNSLGTILILLVNILLVDCIENKKLYKFITLLLTGIYLLFLLGTRTGMLGFILNVIIYICSLIFVNLFKIKKINFKKLGIGIVVIFLVVGSIFLFGSETLQRRKHIAEEGAGIIDVNTGEYGHVTGDSSAIIYQIKNNNVSEDYMSDAQKKTYLDLYEYANKNEIDANDNRKQQLIYHINLIKNQKNILYILFGNGYLANYGEMILEMEVLAILFNFGIVGFVIYLGPFILLLGYLIYKIVKLKKYSVNSLMCLFGICLSFVLSFMAGYVFFSVSCTLIIISMYTLLVREVES